MKRVLVDVNVILDVLLDRPPHNVASRAIWAAIELRSAQGFLAAHAVTTLDYLMRKELGAAGSRRALRALLRIFTVAGVDHPVIQSALDAHATDFDDSVTAVAALAAQCDLIVTRDPKGFRGSVVPVLTPEAAAPLMRPPDVVG
jgi:predicted nucleic acid-binding protein